MPTKSVAATATDEHGPTLDRPSEVSGFSKRED